MLVTVLLILIVLWLLGMVTSYTLGGFIHLLLVIAIVVVLIRIIQGNQSRPLLMRVGQLKGEANALSKRT